MSDGTKIEWTDATVNAVNGCSLASPGCTNCYAMRLAGTRLRNHPSRAGLTIDTKAGPVWNGEVRLNEDALLQPLRWKRPRKIFWNAHGDLFHPNVPDEWIDRQFAVMALTPQHTHQVLTKRPDRMCEYVTRLVDEPSQLTARRFAQVWPSGVKTPKDGITLPLANVWLGTSVEDQTRANERIPHLLATPAAVRFLSCEPLLGLIDLTQIESDGGHTDDVFRLDALKGEYWTWSMVGPQQQWREPGGRSAGGRIDWVIVGGESGPGARPMHPQWARDLRDQCAAAGVAFHFKQWGAWVPNDHVFDREKRSLRFVSAESRLPWGKCQPQMERGPKNLTGRLLDGVQHDGMPA